MGGFLLGVGTGCLAVGLPGLAVPDMTDWRGQLGLSFQGQEKKYKTVSHTLLVD